MHKRKLRSKVENRIQVPCPMRLGHVFRQGSEQAWQGTTFSPSHNKPWELRQTLIRLPSCRPAPQLQRWKQPYPGSPDFLQAQPQGPLRHFCITDLRYKLDFTRGKRPTYLCTHRGKAVVSMATLILRAFNSFTLLHSALYPRHSSLPVLISTLTKGVLRHAQLSAFLLPAGFPCVPGRAERPLGTWIFQNQRTIRWWKPQWAREDRDILTVSSSNFKCHITIKHNGPG